MNEMKKPSLRDHLIKPEEIDSSFIILKPVFSLEEIVQTRFLKCRAMMVTNDKINIKNISAVPLKIFGSTNKQWTFVMNFDRMNVFMCSILIEMKYFEYDWKYSVLDFSEQIHIQKKNEFKAKVYSCNGSEDSDHVSELKKNNILHRISEKMAKSEQSHTFIISLGDTFYYDSIWEDIPELVYIKKLSIEQKASYKVSTKLHNQIFQHMFRKSIDEFKQMQKLMSQSISIMVWDDHDFGINGYHSHEDKLRSCALYQMIGYCAVFNYFLFQLKLNPLKHIPLISINDFNTHYFGSDFFPSIKYEWNRIYEFERVLLLMLDLRTFRTRRSVMKQGSMFRINERMNRIMQNRVQNKRNLPTHCFVASSVPVIFFNVSAIEKAFQKVIKGVSAYTFLMSIIPECLRPSNWIPNSIKNYLTSLSTDFIDQWSNDVHRTEKNALISWIYNWSKQWNNIKMTILAGDVHIPYINYLFEVNASSNDKHEKSTWCADHIVTSALTNKPIPSLFCKVYNTLATINNQIIHDHLMSIRPEVNIDMQSVQELNKNLNNVVQYIDTVDETYILSSYVKWKQMNGRYEKDYFMDENNYIDLSLESHQPFVECCLHTFDCMKPESSNMHFTEIYPN